VFAVFFFLALSTHKEFQMKLGLSLAITLALAVASPAQWLITEIHTGTPDFVEITNVSSAILPVAGIGLLVSNNSVCPSIGPGTTNGPYIATSAATVPPGGTFVFEELGTAGSTALTAPLVGPGERTATSITWANGSILEVSIFLPAVPAPAPNYFEDLPPNVLMDYVQVGFMQAGGVVSLPSDGFRYHRGTALSPTGNWQSGPFFRGPALQDDIFRVSVGGVYVDTNSNADWNSAVSPPHSGGMPNPPGAAGTPTPGCELSIVRPVPGVISLTVSTFNPPLPGTQYFTLISLTPQTCAGFSPTIFTPGPVIGMPPDVWGQLFFPQPSPPFNGFLNAAGSDNFTAPVPGGISFEARTVVLPAGLPTLFSDFVFTTT
jgi:hypothetical protein